MRKKLTSLILILTAIITPLMLQPVTASAATCKGVKPGSSQEQILEGSGQAGDPCDDTQINTTVQAIISILGMVAGIAAVIMIIWSGFKYITSGGDSGKVSSAKTALIYALVGVVVAALAQVLVHFVINSTDGAQVCPTNSKITKGDEECK